MTPPLEPGSLLISSFSLSYIACKNAAGGREHGEATRHEAGKKARAGNMGDVRIRREGKKVHRSSVCGIHPRRHDQKLNAVACVAARAPAERSLLILPGISKPIAKDKICPFFFFEGREKNKWSLKPPPSHLQTPTSRNQLGVLSCRAAG